MKSISLSYVALYECTRSTSPRKSSYANHLIHKPYLWRYKPFQGSGASYYKCEQLAKLHEGDAIVPLIAVFKRLVSFFFPALRLAISCETRRKQFFVRLFETYREALIFFSCKPFYF